MEGKQNGARPRYQRQPRTKRPQPKRVTRKSYRIADVLMVAVLVVSLFTCIWGLALMYDKGFHTGYDYAIERVVRT